jgi:hypothetical protein
MAETRSMTIRRRARLITSFFLRLLLLHLSLTSLEGADPSTTDMLEWERKQEINEAAQKKTAVFPCLFFFSLPAPLSLSRAPPLSLERNESRLFFPLRSRLALRLCPSLTCSQSTPLSGGSTQSPLPPSRASLRRRATPRPLHATMQGALSGVPLARHAACAPSPSARGE